VSGDADLARPDEPRPRLERRGIAASPGVGIGEAYVIGRRRVHVPQRHIAREEVEDEVRRLHAALRVTQDQLEKVKGQLSHGEHRQILKAQQMMLRDPDLAKRTEHLIRDELLNAEWAVARITDDVRETLRKASEDYFRDREFDVAFITERLVRVLLGDHPDEIQPPEGAVIIAHDLSPADTAQLHHKSVAGIVTEVGGRTAHAAIMAHALEIPAVVGVEHAGESVETGDRVIVDAVQGRVIVRPSDAEVDAYRRQASRYAAFAAEVQKEHALPATTRDARHVWLRANIAVDEDLEAAMFHGAEGVGLYRTEYLFLGREEPPSEEEHYRVAKRVLHRCQPYPVVFRTFDLGSDKSCKLFMLDGEEANPAMGVRSLRLALREREHFSAQLRGLLRAGLHGPLRIMLPLVSGVSELRAALALVQEAREQLAEAGMAFSEDVPVGIMIELPSAALVADLLAREVDFMSIGTNDLIQYALAIDRENDDVAYLYQPLHPAILRMIKQVCDAGAAADVPVSLCGEMGGDPLFTWVLVGLGVEELSMHPGAIPVVKSIIRGSRIDEMRGLAARILATSTAEEAEELVLTEMAARFPEHLLHGASANRTSDALGTTDSG
jgi:phosphotransferase system enzyme I (PtsI)